jgi:hypothetical protein
MLVNHVWVRRFPVLFLLLSSLLLSAGCRSPNKHKTSYYPLPSSRWSEQTEQYLVSRKLPAKLEDTNPQSLLRALREKSLNLTDLESMMELSFEKADLTDNTDIYAGVEYYAYAACFAWRILDREGFDNPKTQRAYAIYNACLARVLEDGTRDKGFQMNGQWSVHEKIPSFPVYAHGFPNRVHLFRNLTVPKTDTSYNLTNYYVRKGAGLPVIFHPDAEANSAGAAVLLIGLPVMFSPIYASMTRVINATVESALAKSTNATYLNTQSVLANSAGKFAFAQKVNGVTQYIRANDGIHINTAGHLVLATYVVKKLNAIYGLPVTPAQPTTISY